MKRMIRFMAVAFALVMLAAYVVYSQKQQTRTVAPGSKVLSPPETSGRSNPSNGVKSTMVPTPTNYDFSDVIASSSKSISPVVKVKPTPVPTATTPAPSSDWIPASTSKSGRVFDSSTAKGATDFSRTNQLPAGPAKLSPEQAEASARKIAATNAAAKKASP